MRFEDLSLSDFGGNYFLYIYPLFKDLESEISIKIKSENIQISSIDTHTLERILLYGEEIMSTLTTIFRENSGFTCSADKSRRVTRWMIRRLKGDVKARLKPEGKHTFSDPQFHSSRAYENFFKNHPFVNSRKPKEYLAAYEALKAEISKTHQLVIEAQNDLATYFLKASNRKEILELHEQVVPHRYNNKQRTYKDFAEGSPSHLLHFLKECDPWVISLYRRYQKTKGTEK